MVVTCLCAMWCDVCRSYREGFFMLAARFPQARFVWLDVEDDADPLCELEVEDFPTIVVERDGARLFCGALPPQHAHLERLIETLVRDA